MVYRVSLPFVMNSSKTQMMFEITMGTWQRQRSFLISVTMRFMGRTTVFFGRSILSVCVASHGEISVRKQVQQVRLGLALFRYIRSQIHQRFFRGASIGHF